MLCCKLLLYTIAITDKTAIIIVVAIVMINNVGFEALLINETKLRIMDITKLATDKDNAITDILKTMNYSKR